MKDTSDDTSAPTMLPHGVAPAGGVGETLEGRVVADRYEVESLLGSGGMGAVYRARHVHMRKTVALKVLHREMTHLPEVVARFEREAIAAGHIQHPHVAAATDFGCLEDGSFYLVLEFVDGRSLRDVLDAGPMTPGRAAHVAVQIADALEAAHAEGVIHRDLKPDNVMLVERGSDPDFVKVLDFGIAKLSREETATAPALTQLGAVFGTPEYMSPEQAMGIQVDRRSDLYSLGIILYEMVSGATPFATDDSIAILTRHMTQPPPPLGSEVPEGLRTVVFELLGKRPEDRPATARVVAQRLATLAQPAVASPSSSAVSPPPASGLPAVDAVSGAGSISTVASPPAATGPQYGALRSSEAWVALLALLTRPLRLGGVSAPAWVVLAGAGGSVLIGVLGLLLVVVAVGSRGDRDAAPDPSGRGGTLPGISLPAPPKPIEPAVDRIATQKIVVQIEAKPVYRRTLDDWVALGGAHHDLGQYAESVSAYRNAISKRRSLAKDVHILGHLRHAGRDEVAATQVMTLSETFLLRNGGPGLDLMYQIWEDIKGDPEREALAERYFKKLVILSQRGSDAARVAIELHSKSSCAALLDVVERASTAADARSLGRLRVLERRDGCGAGARQDCYPCLRSSGALERAIQRAERRPGPDLGSEN